MITFTKTEGSTRSICPRYFLISEDIERGIIEIAQPMGPILAIIPVTNPTSTVLFKILISLKTRNPIIICPSKKAVQCCTEAARICYEAALTAKEIEADFNRNY